MKRKVTIQQADGPPTSFLHNGSIGDVIASVPGMKEVYRRTKKKITLYLFKDQKATYYTGAMHPTKSAGGDMVLLNETVIKMLMPLLKAQPCFKDVKIWDGEIVNVNLNDIRTTNVGMPNFCLSRWYFYVFPEMSCDLSKKWLVVPPSTKNLAKGKIIISRTERYNNPNIDYSFLHPYQNDILFAGTELEYVIFMHRFNLKNIKRLVIKDFLELAQAIQQSKFHISNQTMAFQISQGIKHPRIVELCEFAPNVLVIGKDAYDFLSQEGLELSFHRLMGTEKKYIKEYKEKWGNKKTAETVLSQMQQPNTGLSIK